MSDEQTAALAVPTVEELQAQVATLEEQARAAAEQAAEYRNQIGALGQQVAELKQVNEDYQKEVDEKWQNELKKATKKIEAKLIADGKLAVQAVEGEAVLLAEDVRAAVLEVRNAVDTFGHQVHFDTLLQKLGIK